MDQSPDTVASETRRREAAPSDLVDGLTGPSRRSLVLRGPAGIGKSHLADRLARQIETTVVPRTAIRRVYGGESQQFLDFGALLPLLPLDSPPVSAEFELVQRLRRSLVEQATPTVVVVDDVGVLDRKSAAVLDGLIRAGDVVVLATERTAADGERDQDHHLSSVLAEHARAHLMSPLEDAALAALLEEWAGPGEIGSQHRLMAMSAGNPLALRALLDSARSAGAVRHRDGLWYLGDFVPGGRSLEDLVASHLRRLRPAEWDLARTMALAGPIPRKVLARLDLGALEGLERDGLAGGDPVHLEHPLYVEVIRGQLAGEETRRSFTKLATSVSPDDGVDAARLAEWMLTADAGVDDRIARAGAAVAIGRWENDLARRLIEGIESPTVFDLVQLQWALANDGRLDDAAAVADRSVETARSQAERVDAGLARAELWALQLGRSEEAYEHLIELRSSLDEADQVARVDGATALYMRMTGKGSLAASTSLNAGTEDLTDDAARLSVAVAGAFGAVFTGRYESASSHISDGYRLAESLGESHNIVRVAITDALRHLMCGRLDRAESIVERWLSAADVSMVRPAHAVWLGMAAQIARLGGDFERAVRRGREAVRAADHVDDIGAGGFVRGELRAMRIEIGEAADVHPLESPLGGARAELKLTPADRLDAEAAELVRRGREAGYLIWAPFIGLEGIRRGVPAPETARLVAGICAEQDGALVEAIGLHARGHLDGDREHLRAAADAFVELGADAPAVDAVLDELAASVADGGDVTASRRRALSAQAIADRFRPGVPPRVSRRLADLGAELEMPSARQLEVARLVAAGRTSKEVAGELIVSVRTVDNHLAAVYRKLGVSGRDELAELAW